MMTRQWLSSLTIALFGLGGGELLAADRIRIAVANFNVSFMMTGVAGQKGFFRDEGLEPEIIAMRPPVSITALASGDIDYTTVFRLGGAGGGARLAGACRCEFYRWLDACAARAAGIQGGQRPARQDNGCRFLRRFGRYLGAHDDASTTASTRINR